MKSAITVIKEQIEHFYLIRRLSLYELKSKNKNNYLGMAWEIINPAIQILIYWFVFGTLRERNPIMVDGEEIQFFSWLLAAFFLWIFFYQSTIQGSKSIYSRLRMLSKMNFPMSIIPSYVIFSQFYVHLFMLGISMIILQFIGYSISIYYLQLIYYIFATLCLLFAISLITSTLSTIIRDVHMLLNSTLRMMLYLSGVLWPITLLAGFPIIMNLIKLNPLYYLIEGYRSALFGTEWHFITHWEYTLIFWGIVIVLFLFGSMLHVKFRRHFIDYL
ncbi:teichoic acid ABC transporter permease [Virgibacillus profundi]|uniref:Transport permease protein n=1 Tax=Virgibacillus profundi TaxID=2024555 RepID=A0A2A2IHM5_9BACI|nr:ABC transporter permease [Virgibacillus profundi]PAV31289.1 teichoic acid ABC transporter permease [Virgibacillus profundi]PXY55474.1 ABC transporter permease [Virgibacillus profundi]